jgi:UDP-N-acetylmuramoyl-L-alanyl-D-glutamate--2,6-diaminopimelate ligase
MIGSLKKLIGNRNPLRLWWHAARALGAALVYGFPARNLTVIGITGTDGKTTTVGMTAHILHHAGVKVGALSTAAFQIGEERTWNATQKTSPSPFAIQKFLRTLVGSGCTHAVLEVSSHGLVQGRLNWTWPTVAAVTNVAMEHLDYHGSMDQYRADKGMLFRMLHGQGVKVLNADDESLPTYTAITSGRTVTYSIQSQETTLWLDSIEDLPEGPCAQLHVKGRSDPLPLELTIPGAFNLENALCAIGCAVAVGIDPDVAVKALRTFQGVPGRLERIDEGQAFSVFVDFTVTPQAYEKTLTTLRSMLPDGKRLLVLTGSCGDRMKEKRPIIGRMCSDLADVVVVTNEDPYTEDPQAIIDEVWSGIDQSKTSAHQIFDRGEAMQFIFNEAQPRDIVILCAKGSDTTMWTTQGQIPWDERSIAREFLRSL